MRIFGMIIFILVILILIFILIFIGTTSYCMKLGEKGVCNSNKKNTSEKKTEE